MYNIKTSIKPKNLNSISNSQIEDHWKLYEGYVKQVNQIIKTNENRHMLSFELNGLLLHELYFENLGKHTKLPENSSLKTAILKTWGSIKKWEDDFIKTGLSRGIGWAILYTNKASGNLFNIFVKNHENGHPAGLTPLLVMDVWEHAYMVDHNANGRKDYIAAFMKNVRWDIIEKRFNS
ncbi:superoxide dismutase [Candidatus Dependentiae bacterium]